MYSGGKCNSFQPSGAGGSFGNSGLNLDHELGAVPPSVPTEPVSTFRKCRLLETCHPPKFPIDAALHTCDDNLLPAFATILPVSMTCSTGILHSSDANSGVY